MHEMKDMECLESIIYSFDIEGTILTYGKYGNGHINDTYDVVLNGTLNNRYILQRINISVFREPERLMENIVQVTSFIRKEVEKKNGNSDREVLNVIRTKNGASFYKDNFGDYYRMYRFIEDAACYEGVSKAEDFYQSAVAFGNFQKQLSGFNASVLYETIPEFHNTPLRYQHFLNIIQKDAFERVKEVKEEIAFFIEREQDMKICCSYLDSGKVPLRVTHNDTKLNNVMIDNKTGKGLCVIDLDTVMPGLSIFDFGDSIRFGANTAAEDETDLSKVHFDLGLFETYVKGYLEGCGDILTETEILLMPYGAKTMTLECGMRFLTDYLEGDIYFKTHRDKHNLDRCRTQIALVKDMELKWKDMQYIVNKAK